MKYHAQKTVTLIPAVLTVSALLATSAMAGLQYWDPQGTTGANPYIGDLSGSWEGNNWSTASGGTASPGAWVEGNAACFGVHTGKGTPAFTVTANANHSIGGFFNGPLAPNSCDVTIAGSGTLTLNSANENAFDVLNASDGSLAFVRVNNVLAGSSTARLTAEGNAQVFLNAANTWSGGTELGYSGASFSGILNFNNNASFGTGPIVMTNGSGSALVVSGASAVTLANTVSNVMKYATLNLVGNAAGVTFSGNWWLNSGTTLNVGSGGSGNVVTISGVIGGAGAFMKALNNGSPLVLRGANTYSGLTSITNGTLRLGVANAIPSGSGKGNITILTPGILDLGGFNCALNGFGSTSTGTIDNSSGSGTYTLTLGNNNGGGTFSGVLQNTSGNIAIIKTGTGNMTFSGIANTYSGGTTVTGGGALSISADGALGAVPSSPAVNITLDNGCLRNNSSSPNLNVNRIINITANGGYFDAGWAPANPIIINGQITGSGILAIDQDGSPVVLKNTANNWTGATIVGAKGPGYYNNANAVGWLQLGANNVLPTGSGYGDVYVTNAVQKNVLDLAGFSATINGLWGDAFVNNTVGGASTLTVGNNDATSTFSGVISNAVGTVALTKIGAGTLTLSGANKYTGATTVSAGTLDVQGTLASPSVAVASGATLELDASASLSSSANLIVSPGLPVVNLNFSGTSTIHYLSLDGGTTYAAPGTWGPVGSGATFTDSRLTGTGILSVMGAPTIVVGSSSNPSTYGDSVTLNASVSGSGSATPTGSVTFKDGATVLGTATLDGSGNASMSVTSFNAGTHSITVAYSGDATYGSGVSSPLSQVVNQAVLNVSASGTLVYGQDPTNAVYTAVFYPLLGSDTASVVSGQGNFTTDATATNYINSYVGTNYTTFFVDAGTLTAANYTFVAGTNGILTITPASLTVTNVVASDKTYDATTAATLDFSGAGLFGLVNGDDATVSLVTSSGVGVFSDKNVGSGKTVTVSGLSIAGELGTNYTLIQPTTTASITPASLTVTATGVNKVYDGNATATVTLAATPLGTDSVTPAYTSASFADKTAAPGKTVSVSGISLTGTDAGNYTPNATAATTADITARTLNVTATGVNKVYDGTAVATVTLADDRVAGDVFTDSYSAAAFADANIGTGKAVSVSGIGISGTDAGNYSLASTSASTAADITVRTLNVTATGVSKVYDGTTAATVTLATDKVGSDDVSASYTLASFADANVGTAKDVSVSGISISGTAAGNYNLANTTASATADITGADSSTVLASSLNPSTEGSNVTFTATVSSAAGTPTGDVVFLANGVPFSTNALVSGVAAASTTALAVGTNTIAAQYATQANWLLSGATLDQVVNSAVVYSQTNAVVSIAANGDGTYTLSLLGTPGASYYVVSSADVSAAMTNWSALTYSTNTASSPSGQWSVVVSNAAPAFYRSVAVNPAP